MEWSNRFILEGLTVSNFSFNLNEIFLQKRVELNEEISMEGFFPDDNSATSWAVIGAPINPR